MTTTELSIDSVERRVGYWSIYPVTCQGKQERFDLLNGLLDNGAARTQDEWSKYTKEARARNDFGVESLPRYHALFATLYQHKDGQNKVTIQEIQRFLKDKFNKHWLTSLTRIRYARDGQDNIIHDYGLPSQSEVLEDMVGPDERIKDAQNKNAYKALFGTDDIAEINATYRWITEKDAHLWRMRNKPKEDVEYVARFSAVSGRSNFSCSRGLQSSGASFGVRRASGASKSGAATQKSAPSLESFLEFTRPFLPTERLNEYETKLKKEFK